MVRASSAVRAWCTSIPRWRNRSVRTSARSWSSSTSSSDVDVGSSSRSWDIGSAVDPVRPVALHVVRHSGGSTGSVIVMVAPAPGALSAQIRPPCCSTMVRQMASPRPVPSFSRASEPSTCWKRSKIELQLLGRDAAALVATWNQSSFPVVARRRAVTVPPSERELDGVAEQVGERLHDAVGIGPHARRLGLDLPRRTPAARPSAASTSMDRVAERRDCRSAAAGATTLPESMPLDVEDVVDQPDQPVGVVDRDVDHPLAAVR